MGEMIIIDGKKYIEKDTTDLPFGNVCRHCALSDWNKPKNKYEMLCCDRKDFSCHSDSRQDGRDVVFVEVK